MITVFKKLILLSLAASVGFGAGALLIDRHVRMTGYRHIIDIEALPEADAILVLGALVFPDGRVSSILADRLITGIQLYEQGKAPKLLLSGDNGRKDYDEVNGMKEFVLDRKVPAEDVFMDHAGFNTYESLYRARDIFQVNRVIIVTQEYHLLRALYIAEKLGIEAYGVPSDRHRYQGMARFELREIFARNKAFFWTKLQMPPTYLGDVIPISGDGRITDDQLNPKAYR